MCAAVSPSHSWGHQGQGWCSHPALLAGSRSPTTSPTRLRSRPCPKRTREAHVCPPSPRGVSGVPGSAQGPHRNTLKWALPHGSPSLKELWHHSRAPAHLGASWGARQPRGHPRRTRGETVAGSTDKIARIATSPHFWGRSGKGHPEAQTAWRCGLRAGDRAASVREQPGVGAVTGPGTVLEPGHGASGKRLHSSQSSRARGHLHSRCVPCAQVGEGQRQPKHWQIGRLTPQHHRCCRCS